MKLNEYQELAGRTMMAPGHNHGGMTDPKTVDLVHVAFGLAGEAGELTDTVKRAVMYGKARTKEEQVAMDINLREEAGDTLWYIAGPLCRALGCTLEELAAENVAKLQKRYPDKYTDQAALARADKL